MPYLEGILLRVMRYLAEVISSSLAVPVEISSPELRGVFRISFYGM